MKSCAVTLAATFATLLLPPISRAQGTTATATEAIRLQVFGVGSYVRPDYGEFRGAGGFALGGGAGFTVPHLHQLEPGIELRYSYATNQDITQTVFSGGLRATYHVARFHPYGDLLIGSGNINFKQVNPAYSNYTHDNSTVFTYGGGVDYDVTRSVGLRFDLQKQRWRLGEANQPFYPSLVSAGIRYQFHFRNKFGPE